MQASAEQQQSVERRSDEATQSVERAYKFADLSAYSFKERFLIRAADLIFYVFINLIGRTARFEVEGWENWEAIERHGHLPIGAFWHNEILLTTYWWRHRGVVVMTSQSFDGEYIARFIQRFGYGAARGSSTRGSVGALVEMARLMRRGCKTAFTIDGPKGPPHIAKMGAVLLAKKTGHPIQPIAMIPSHYYEAPSWDHLQVPLPFTRARVLLATPIYVPPDADEGMLQAKRNELQRALDGLNLRGQQWRAART